MAINSSVTVYNGDDDPNVLNGDDGDNAMYGKGGGDLIYAYGGNDLLDGGTGADAMWGGSGDDTYYVDDIADAITETAGGGLDTVYAWQSYALSDFVDNLVLLGAANINATGDRHRNFLVGNAGNNVLDGKGGRDDMTGGDGDDTYYVDNPGDRVNEAFGAGTDTVYSSISFSLAGKSLEILILTGEDNINATGSSRGNTITGNNGNNIIDGGKGADRMSGGLGDDTYYVDNIGDTVTEVRNDRWGGVDTVISSVSFTLGADVDNLTLTGSANLNGTGNSADNTLIGNSGNNVLDGGAGLDVMKGGLGNDTYYVDTYDTTYGFDNVIEAAGQGTDTIYSSVDLELSANVENLILTGGAHQGRGNALDNEIKGNSRNNLLSAGGGNDVISGGAGDDYIYGGIGNDRVDGGSGNDILYGDDRGITSGGADVFRFGLGSGQDKIRDFRAADNDTINIHAYTHGTPMASIVSQDGAHVVIDLGGGNTVTVLNSVLADVMPHIVW